MRSIACNFKPSLTSWSSRARICSGVSAGGGVVVSGLGGGGIVGPGGVTGSVGGIF